MAHDPEADAARYLGGDMSAGRRARFSDHLLGCDVCWQEVVQAQEGRRLVEAARSLPPAHLREGLRALAEAAEPPSEAPGRRRVAPVARQHVAVAVAATVLAAVTVTGLQLRDRATGDPAALQAAVADFNDRELPGQQLPRSTAPDLSGLRLRPIGAGGGRYDGLAVDGYAYRDDAGRRIVLYLSPEPFPAADGVQALAGPDGPWIVRRGDVVVLCARAPQALLVVGQDDDLVRSTAVALGVL